MRTLSRRAVRLAVVPILIAVTAAAPNRAATHKRAPVPVERTSRTPDQRAAAMLARMTRDEKLTLVFGYFGTDFPSKAYSAVAGAREGSAGYIPGIARLRIPAQWQTDAGIGVATQGNAKTKRLRTALPSGLATAASWNPELARAAGAMIGDEARRSGFNVMLAGGVDLLREPRNGRNFEYGGEDPLLAGTIVGAQVAGIQSNHIISTIKHFAINDQETDRDTGNSVIDLAAARTSDLFAFQIALERSRAGAVMCSYNRVNGDHACENGVLLTDVLRHDWAWPGYVMSDWGATHSTAKAAKAGLDQDSGFPFDKEAYFGAPLKAAIADGSVSAATLDTMARRILRSLYAAGIFDHPVAEQAIDFPAHAAVTRRGAEEGAVLLKNTGAILPLSPSTRRIAVIGGHADKGVLAGGGSSLVYPIGSNAVPGLTPTAWPGPILYYPSSPLEAIRRQAPGATIVYADGSDAQAAAALARSSDVAIVFGTQWAGESFDVALALDGAQDALIDTVAAANPRTVVVLETGGPVLMPWVGKVGAVLETWYPGTEGGAAIGNLLFGVANPSGHLPATFPRSLDQLPRPAAPNIGDTRYTEGAAVGYKWYDRSQSDPLFAFGHGLSYTDFVFSGLSAGASGNRITARFTVRNIGARAGMAVPQLYASSMANDWEAPRRLAGWRKLSVARGSTQTATVEIDPRLFATWDEGTHGWRIAAGRYRLTLAKSAGALGESVVITLPSLHFAAGWHPSK